MEIMEYYLVVPNKQKNSVVYSVLLFYNFNTSIWVTYVNPQFSYDKNIRSTKQMVTLEKVQGAGNTEQNKTKCSKYIFINTNTVFFKDVQ